MHKDTIDAMVEIAAMELNENFSDEELTAWEDLSEETRDKFRRDALIAIEAAMAFLSDRLFAKAEK